MHTRAPISKNFFFIIFTSDDRLAVFGLAKEARHDADQGDEQGRDGVEHAHTEIAAGICDLVEVVCHRVGDGVGRNAERRGEADDGQDGSKAQGYEGHHDLHDDADEQNDADIGALAGNGVRQRLCLGGEDDDRRDQGEDGRRGAEPVAQPFIFQHSIHGIILPPCRYLRRVFYKYTRHTRRQSLPPARRRGR